MSFYFLKNKEFFFIPLCMLRWYLYSVIILFTSFSYAQDLEHYNPLKAEILGGNEQLEQVLQTQLTLPKNILNSDFHDDINVYFLIDSSGNISESTLKSNSNNRQVHKEILRLLKFIKFKRTYADPLVPYVLSIPVSTDKYKRYFKQKSKFTVKSNLPADSSLVVYARADKSPNYYKNGDSGFDEFLLNNLEYPKVAIEKSIEGTVIIEFVVETNGFVTGLKSLHGVNGGCTEEGMRLISQSKWQPAELNNKLVRYRTRVPITFSLRNVTRNVGYSSQTIGQ